MAKWSASEYAGPIENGWEQGHGKFKFPNGVVYEGNFDKGEFHGDGTLHYPNGVSPPSARSSARLEFSVGEGSLAIETETEALKSARATSTANCLPAHARLGPLRREVGPREACLRQLLFL